MSKNSLEEQIADHVMKYRENHYRLAYSYVKNAEDALDIVQESVYKAILYKDSLKNINYIRTWFYKILINTSLDFIRKNRKIKVVDEDNFEKLDSCTEDYYENFDLKSSLDDLPDKYRTVIILRYFEDMKIDEIAEILNENVNTVKTRLYKSLKILRIKMEDYEEV
jgi:RNA polymerase sigma-70 factor (ECF subfamily)